MMSNHTTNVVPMMAGELFNRTYIVPLYQREYAWGQKEIGQLLDDLWDAFKVSPTRNYHLGSITVFPRRGAGGITEYELIDGQQRGITLGLLLRLLSPTIVPMGLAGRLRFVNRPEAEMFLAAFDASPEVVPSTPRTFRSAVNAMRDHEVFGEERKDQRGNFEKFVREQVVLFRVEMPPETDVSAYFEVMNNRGVQLEFADLLKARFIAKLGEGTDKVLFDRLWTACSNMDGYLSDWFDEDTIAALEVQRHWWQLEEAAVKIREVSASDATFRSIVPDFPNFLLHVLRVFLTRMSENVKSVRLDERQMRQDFDTYFASINAENFLDVLLQTRLRFDRYIIKSEGGEDGGESRWSLAGNKSWSAETPTVEERLMHLQAMLQVTNPSRRNKEWLSLLLCNEGVKNPPELISLLERFARDRLKERGSMVNWIQAGTGTPHLALNLIDYLMYCENPNEYCKNKAFRFAYRNSVEHHFPQGSVSEETAWTNETVNDIGNLYLLSKSDNLSLNVRSPNEKVVRAGDRLDFPPKRREMYRLTKECGWTPMVMRQHSEKVCKLLSAFLGQ